MKKHPNPNDKGSPVQFKSRYANFVGGEWVPPKSGKYFENVSPVTGKAFCEIPRSDHPDIELDLFGRSIGFCPRLVGERLRRQSVATFC